MKYEAIVYGWRNIIDGKMYIGFHKTDEEFDGYVTSSEDEELQYAWANGHMRRSIIYRGTQSIAITLENYLLKSIKANKNPDFYNKSVGGGVGCVKDFSNLTESVKLVGENWIKGIEPEENLDYVDVADQDVTEAIKARLAAEHYIEYQAPTKEIFALPKNQIRFNTIEPEHLEDIKDLMRDDPLKARRNISPIIIVVNEKGEKMILDGNHTITAAYEVNWPNVPVIYINSSEFLNKQANYDDFGLLMNHQEKKKKPNDKGALKRGILNLLQTTGLSIDSTTFKNTALRNLVKYYSKNAIAHNIKSVEKMLREEQEVLKNNFKRYTKKELETIVGDLEAANPKVGIISISSDRCMNDGLGAVLNKMGGMDVTEGIIVISHRNMTEYKLRKAHTDKLKKAMKPINAKITINELPAFIKTK
jgi:hypothetical protein